MEKSDEGGVSPVIATILMVAITVVLAAVLYAMIGVIIPPPQEPKPRVALSSQSCAPSACDGKVAEISAATDLNRFRVTVIANGAVVFPPTTLTANMNLTGGGLTFRYTDVGGEGKMTGGDTFRLSGIAAGGTYEVSLLWKDGTVVQSITFPS